MSHLTLTLALPMVCSSELTPGGLACTRTDPHSSGHVYVTGSGLRSCRHEDDE